MKNFGLDTRGIRFWAILIFILIMVPGCVGVGALIKGNKIPPGQIMDFMTANEIDNSEMKDKLSDTF